MTRRIAFDQAYIRLAGGPVRRFAAGATGELPDREADQVVAARIGHYADPPKRAAPKPKAKAKAGAKAKTATRGRKK